MLAVYSPNKLPSYTQIFKNILVDLILQYKTNVTCLPNLPLCVIVSKSQNITACTTALFKGKYSGCKGEKKKKLIIFEREGCRAEAAFDLHC